MQLAFGAGALWGNRTDTTGSGIGPNQFGILQNMTIDWNWDTKELRGRNQFPVDYARAGGKVTGRASFARIFGQLYGDCFFGTTPTTAGLVVSENEAGTVPASSTYTVTPTQAATYSDDLGVMYASGASAGNRFTRVSSPSAAGEYSVNTSTGVYTFGAADASAAVLISYLYTRVTGKRIAIDNQIMGYTPTFKITATNGKKTQGTTHSLDIVLYSCTASKLSIPTRLDDYMIEEMDFMACADATGAIGVLSTNE